MAYRSKKVQFKRKHKTAASVGKPSLLSEEEVVEYLTYNRERVIDKLKLRKVSEGQIRPILKQAILSYAQTYNFCREEDKPFYCANVYELLSSFKAIDFISRNWQYCPQYISKFDYEKLQDVDKNHIFMRGYDYESPVYSFENDYTPQDPKKTKYDDIVKTDAQFFVDTKSNHMFGKLVRLKYVPHSKKTVKEAMKKYEGEEDLILNDPEVYDKILSISLCVLFNGDPKKTMPLIRYDSSKLLHTNVYVGNDKRREIFGDYAESPHFHFQNEDDSLLCLKKYKNQENGKMRYKSGRCNAIDCKHLRTYLQDLDSLSEKEVSQLVEQKKDYGMPFLRMKDSGKKFVSKFTRNVQEFLQGMSEEELKACDLLVQWLEKAQRNPEYKNGSEKCFAKMLRTLDFLNYLVKFRAKIEDCKLLKKLTELEILIADDFMNGICNIHSYETKNNLDEETIDLFISNPQEIEG